MWFHFRDSLVARPNDILDKLGHLMEEVTDGVFA